MHLSSQLVDLAARCRGFVMVRMTVSLPSFIKRALLNAHVSWTLQVTSLPFLSYVSFLKLTEGRQLPEESCSSMDHTGAPRLWLGRQAACPCMPRVS